VRKSEGVYLVYSERFEGGFEKGAQRRGGKNLREMGKKGGVVSGGFLS